jgi:hypothetical protein
MEDEAQDRTQWKTRFGRGYGPDLRQSTQSMHVILSLKRAKKPLFVFSINTIEYCCVSQLSLGRIRVVCKAAS